MHRFLVATVGRNAVRLAPFRANIVQKSCKHPSETAQYSMDRAKVSVL